MDYDDVFPHAVSDCQYVSAPSRAGKATPVFVEALQLRSSSSPLRPRDGANAPGRRLMWFLTILLVAAFYLQFYRTAPENVNDTTKGLGAAVSTTESANAPHYHPEEDVTLTGTVPCSLMDEEGWFMRIPSEYFFPVMLVEEGGEQQMTISPADMISEMLSVTVFTNLGWAAFGQPEDDAALDLQVETKPPVTQSEDKGLKGFINLIMNEQVDNPVERVGTWPI